MKNFNALFVLATSMISLTVNAMDTASVKNNSTFVLKMGKYGTMKFSLTPAEGNGNFLHNLLDDKCLANENAKLTLKLELEIGYINKEKNEAILRAPYNRFPEEIAREMCGKHQDLVIFDQIFENASKTLLELLSQKNDDGKTPVDLLKEKDVYSAQAIENNIKPVLEDYEKRQIFKSLVLLNLMHHNIINF